MRTIISWAILFIFTQVPRNKASIVNKTDEIIGNINNGQKFDVSPNQISISQDYSSQIENYLKISDKKTLQQALQEREAFEQEYRDKSSGKNAGRKIKIPKRAHSDGHVNHGNSNKRFLASTSNQFANIDQGNSDQVTDGNYVYSLRNSRLTVHKVSGVSLALIYNKQFSDPLYPKEMHASQGYLAVVLQNYVQTQTVIQVYEKDQNDQLRQIRQYKKQGYYVASREYNSELLVLLQIEMKSAKLDYTWTVDNSQIKDTVFQGMSANKSSNNLGNAARSLARIPLGPVSNLDYNFATYLFCDFAWDLVLSEQLNVFIGGNYYNSSNYAVSFQTFSLNEKDGVKWGASKWAVLPGIINNNYQIQQFNGFLRVLTLYADGDFGTAGHVSVAKVPMLTFDPSNGQIYRQLGVQGSSFVAARWRRDVVFIIFQDGLISLFSSSLGSSVSQTKVQGQVYQLYPYGDNNMIGFGTTLERNYVELTMFSVRSTKLIYMQTITLNSSSYSYSSYGWYSSQFLQFDWQNKRVTFPVFSSEEEPYKSGYYQIYANPNQKCMSSLPVTASCSSVIASTADVRGKLFKHWDQTLDYNFSTGLSQQIRRSSTINVNGQTILITGSPCQLQARIIKDPKIAPVYSLSNNAEVNYVDLCV